MTTRTLAAAGLLSLTLGNLALASEPCESTSIQRRLSQAEAKDDDLRPTVALIESQCGPITPYSLAKWSHEVWRSTAGPKDCLVAHLSHDRNGEAWCLARVTRQLSLIDLAIERWADPTSWPNQQDPMRDRLPETRAERDLVERKPTAWKSAALERLNAK